MATTYDHVKTGPSRQTKLGKWLHSSDDQARKPRGPASKCVTECRHMYLSACTKPVGRDGGWHGYAVNHSKPRKGRGWVGRESMLHGGASSQPLAWDDTTTMGTHITALQLVCQDGTRQQGTYTTQHFVAAVRMEQSRRVREEQDNHSTQGKVYGGWGQACWALMASTRMQVLFMIHAEK